MFFKKNSSEEEKENDLKEALRLGRAESLRIGVGVNERMADREGDARWDGLCSRDAGSRDVALENIRQAVLKKSEAMASGKEMSSPSPVASASEELLPAAPTRAQDGLNEMLARLLMLSKRCPFRDVREKSAAILRTVQVKVTNTWVNSVSCKICFRASDLKPTLRLIAAWISVGLPFRAKVRITIGCKFCICFFNR